MTVHETYSLKFASLHSWLPDLTTECFEEHYLIDILSMHRWIIMHYCTLYWKILKISINFILNVSLYEHGIVQQTLTSGAPKHRNGSRWGTLLHDNRRCNTLMSWAGPLSRSGRNANPHHTEHYYLISVAQYILTITKNWQYYGSDENAMWWYYVVRQ